MKTHFEAIWFLMDLSSAWLEHRRGGLTNTEGVNTHMPGGVLSEVRNRAAALGCYLRLPLAATQRGGVRLVNEDGRTSRRLVFGFRAH